VIDIRTLLPDDAGRLTPLLAAYSAEMLHGGPPHHPDEAYAASLLAEPMVILLGAFENRTLLGFALAYDLPEAISGRRAGQLDDLFVLPAGRGKGLAQALVDRLVTDGAGKGWVHLRWMLPDGNPAAPLYERIAERAPWRNFVIRIDRTYDW
jgi:GNAT superfamily N-acetyltransferase